MTMANSKNSLPLEKKYRIILEDLERERRNPAITREWQFRLDQKIADWKLAMKERGYK